MTEHHSIHLLEMSNLPDVHKVPKVPKVPRYAGLVNPPNIPASSDACVMTSRIITDSVTFVKVP